MPSTNKLKQMLEWLRWCVLVSILESKKIMFLHILSSSWFFCLVSMKGFCGKIQLFLNTFSADLLKQKMSRLRRQFLYWNVRNFYLSFSFILTRVKQVTSKHNSVLIFFIELWITKKVSDMSEAFIFENFWNIFFCGFLHSLK